MHTIVRGTFEVRCRRNPANIPPLDQFPSPYSSSINELSRAKNLTSFAAATAAMCGEARASYSFQDHHQTLPPEISPRDLQSPQPEAGRLFSRGGERREESLSGTWTKSCHILCARGWNWPIDQFIFSTLLYNFSSGLKVKF